MSNLKTISNYLLIKWILSIDKINIQHNFNTWIWLPFSTFSSLKKYPKISGYLDRISKIWIMKKIDIQSIQVSMYPKKMDIHVSMYPWYPSIHDIQISNYPSIQKKSVSKISKYPDIRKKWYPSIPTHKQYNSS